MNTIRHHPHRDPPSTVVAGTAFRGRRGRRRLLAAMAGAVIAVSSFTPAATAARAPGPAETASVVSAWDAIATSTLFGDSTKVPQEVIVYLGFMHAAIYDAVVGIHGRYQPFRSNGRAPHGASATAAAAAAAHRILEVYSQYAQAALDADLAASLALIPDGTAKTDGVAYGERVAQNMIDSRVGDGRNAPVLYTKPPAPGVWRPTPPAFAPMALPWLGGVTPLLVRSASQFAPPPPPTLTSRRYTRDFDEVKAFGSATSTARSAEQTATALFFSGNVILQFSSAMRDQAAARSLDLVDTARMYAQVDMTIVDAIITTWRTKLKYGFWRPSTAIQLADTDGNPATVADPAWTPLLVNPPYPDYVSGYNTVAAAGSRTLDHLFGPHLGLNLISTAVPGVVRHYDSGSDLRADVVNARIWLGIHFRTADVQGRNVGINVADWVSGHDFRPADD